MYRHPRCDRLQLRQRIGRRYELVNTSFTFGPLTLPFTCVADPDRVLDEVAAEEDRLERVSGRGRGVKT